MRPFARAVPSDDLNFSENRAFRLSLESLENFYLRSGKAMRPSKITLTFPIFFAPFRTWEDGSFPQ